MAHGRPDRGPTVKQTYINTQTSYGHGRVRRRFASVANYYYIIVSSYSVAERTDDNFFTYRFVVHAAQNAIAYYKLCSLYVRLPRHHAQPIGYL